MKTNRNFATHIVSLCFGTVCMIGFAYGQDNAEQNIGNSDSGNALSQAAGISVQSSSFGDTFQNLLQSSDKIRNLLRIRQPREIYQYLDSIFPVTQISHGAGEASALPTSTSDVDFSALTMADDRGRSVSFSQWQDSTFTDALLIMHKGQIVYERYYTNMDDSRRHALWSGSKSLVGALATDLIQSGQLDPSSTIGGHLPELNGSAWADATVQQTLDMTTAVNYTESLNVKDGSGTLQYLIAGGFIPVPNGYNAPRTMLDLLKSLRKNGEHGAVFNYKNVDTEVLALVLTKVTGKDLATLISERIWAPMGAADNAYVIKDRAGLALGGSGVGTTARDLARFGETVRLDGRYNGHQILQPGTLAQIQQGGSRQAFASGSNAARTGYSYHNFWWIDHENGTIEMKGANGQHLHINPSTETVIVKLSSNLFSDMMLMSTHTIDRNAFAAISRELVGR